MGTGTDGSGAWKLPPEPLLELVAKQLSDDAPDWQGTPTELVSLLGVDMKPNALTMKLNNQRQPTC
jgi:hypothetical protein